MQRFDPTNDELQLKRKTRRKGSHAPWMVLSLAGTEESEKESEEQEKVEEGKNIRDAETVDEDEWWIERSIDDKGEGDEHWLPEQKSCTHHFEGAESKCKES